MNSVMKKTYKINRRVISKLKPCKKRFDNYLKYHNDFNGNLEQFLLLKNITYNDKVWVVTRLFSEEQNIRWALACASSVLYKFESEYPNDKRPRQALESVEAYINNPCEETRANANAAYAYAYAAYADSASAYTAAAYVTIAASAYAYVAAAYTAAAYAAASASVSASAEQQEVNLILMADCFMGRL